MQNIIKRLVFSVFILPLLILIPLSAFVIPVYWVLTGRLSYEDWLRLINAFAKKTIDIDLFLDVI